MDGKPKNAAPAPPAALVDLTPEQAVLLLYLDLAAAQLDLQRLQLERMPGMPAEAVRVWALAVRGFQAAREQVLKNLSNRVLLATPADVPPGRS